MTRTAPIPSYDTLLLEGGSLRCAFTAGVLDAFAAVGYRDFPRIYAVSAGAMAATSFLSGQRKHFIEVATSVIADGQFIRFSSALSEEGIMNLAHLFDHVRRHHPLDFEGAAEAARLREVRFVTTDAETGRPLYLDPVKGNWLRILWASATLPMVTRGRIKVEGRWMFDGGIADALPLQAAIDAGARNLLVIRTRPSGMHVQQSWMDYFATYWYRENPAIAALYESGHETYNEAVDRIASGGEDGISIHEIAPDEPLKSDGYQVQVESLWADYHQGLAKGLDLVASRLT
ncbi:MAG: patatin-like phospholipase family protein [Flavobacteriales bacterium]